MTLPLPTWALAGALTSTLVACGPHAAVTRCPPTAEGTAESHESIDGDKSTDRHDVAEGDHADGLSGVTPPANETPPASAPFPPALTYCDRSVDECAADEICVEEANRPSRECVPTVPTEELSDPRWDGRRVMVRAPRVTTYDRKLTCKAKHCAWPGVALQLEASLIPLERGASETFPKSRLSCSPHAQGGPVRWKCPTDGATAVFGVVHQSTFPGRTTPDAAFELLAVELAPKRSPTP